MDIREYNRLIVKKERLFLWCKDGNRLVWDASPYHAWHTKNRTAAVRVAEKVGGDVWWFNPAAGALQLFRKTG